MNIRIAGDHRLDVRLIDGGCEIVTDDGAIVRASDEGPLTEDEAGQFLEHIASLSLASRRERARRSFKTTSVSGGQHGNSH